MKYQSNHLIVKNQDIDLKYHLMEIVNIYYKLLLRVGKFIFYQL